MVSHKKPGNTFKSVYGNVLKKFKKTRKPKKCLSGSDLMRSSRASAEVMTGPELA